MPRPVLNGALPLGLIVLALLGLLGCGQDARNDSALLLRHYDQLDLDEPSEVRRQHLARLKALRFQTEEVRGAQTVCVNAHEAVLEAESLHAEANRLLAPFEREHRRVPREQGQRIERAIQTADRHLRRSRQLFPRCERQIRTLRTRYRPQRASGPR